MNDAVLRDLVEQLQQPRVKWTCVVFAVVILVRMKLYLFALAVPVMAYYYSPNLEGSEEQSPEREEKRSPDRQVPDFDQDDDELDGDFDRGPIQQPMDDQEEGDTDPYDQSFWGAGDSKPQSTPSGGAKPAAKKSSMGDDSEELPWSKPSPSRPETTLKAAPWDEEPIVGIGDDLDSFPSDVLPGKSLGGSMDFGGAGPDMSDMSFDFLGHGKDDDSDLLGFGGGDSGMGRGKGKGKGKKGDKNGGKGEKGPMEADPKQVFVAGVADMIEDEIRSVFEEVGDIDRLKVLRQPDGQSKGVCFITFRTEDQANRALALSGKDCGGKSLVVRHAHGAGQTKGDGKGESRGKGDRNHLHGDSMSSRQGAPDLGGSGRFGAAFGEDHRGGGGPPREGGGKGGRGKGGGGRGGGGGFGRDRADLDEALEQALAEVPGPVRVSDFDFPCRRFLAELRNRDRADGSTRFQDALDMVSKYTSARDRSSVRKWPAYIFMLLQKFDSTVWHELQEKDAERRSHRDDNMRPRRPAAHDDD